MSPPDLGGPSLPHCPPCAPARQRDRTRCRDAHRPAAPPISRSSGHAPCLRAIAAPAFRHHPTFARHPFRLAPHPHPRGIETRPDAETPSSRCNPNLPAVRPRLQPPGHRRPGPTPPPCLRAASRPDPARPPDAGTPSSRSARNLPTVPHRPRLRASAAPATRHHPTLAGHPPPLRPRGPSSRCAPRPHRPSSDASPTRQHPLSRPLAQTICPDKSPLPSSPSARIIAPARRCP